MPNQTITNKQARISYKQFHFLCEGFFCAEQLEEEKLSSDKVKILNEVVKALKHKRRNGGKKAIRKQNNPKLMLMTFLFSIMFTQLVHNTYAACWS